MKYLRLQEDGKNAAELEENKNKPKQKILTLVADKGRSYALAA